MKKIWNFIKKHKIITILIALVLVIAIVATVFFVKINSKKQGNTTYSYTRTVTLSKSSLDKTVSATGTVESQNTTNVTASSDATYNVKTIYVKVGDVVKEGDTIAVLDTTELTKQITKQQETIADQIKQAQHTYDNAVSSKDEIWGQRETAITTLNNANTALSLAKSNYDYAVSSVTYYQDIYDDAYDELEDATATYNACLDAETSACELEKNNYDTAKTKLDNATRDLNDVKTSSNYDTYEKEYNSAVQTQSQAQSNYDNLNAKFASANYAIETAKENLEKASTNDTIEELQTKLANCIIKATSSGTITALNMTVGSRPSGTLATIQDLDKLKVSISVQEYDINDVEVGMKAVITSDATETEMTGKVSQISPVASSQGMGSSSSTFACEVTIDNPDPGLLIGMNAKVVITTSSVDDVYTVPIDAVEEDGGKSYIYVQNDAGEYDKTEVTVGDSNDYYVEISGSNLKEGMVVRASAVESEATETTTEQGFGMFGGFGGGEMPQGGGDMPSGGGNMPSGGGGPSGGGAPSGGPNG